MLSNQCSKCPSSVRAKGLCAAHYQKHLRDSKGECTFRGCNNPWFSRGFCSTHYKKLRKSGDLKPTRTSKGCATQGCNNPHRALGFCNEHYLAHRRSLSSKTLFNLTARLSRYNLTQTRWVSLYETQGHACAICKIEIPIADLYIDHDHKCCPTYKSCGNCVRGLLCSHCNFLIGNAKESVERLAAAISYLS